MVVSNMNACSSFQWWPTLFSSGQFALLLRIDDRLHVYYTYQPDNVFTKKWQRSMISIACHMRCPENPIHYANLQLICNQFNRSSFLSKAKRSKPNQRQITAHRVVYQSHLRSRCEFDFGYMYLDHSGYHFVHFRNTSSAMHLRTTLPDS